MSRGEGGEGETGKDGERESRKRPYSSLSPLLKPFSGGPTDPPPRPSANRPTTGRPPADNHLLLLLYTPKQGGKETEREGRWCLCPSLYTTPARGLPHPSSAYASFSPAKPGRSLDTGGTVQSVACSRTRSLCIRGHRPKSSLGDKILANREGDYKNCFREGKHFLGYGKDTRRKFIFLQIFSQKY